MTAAAAAAAQKILEETIGVPVARQRLWLFARRENNTWRIEEARAPRLPPRHVAPACSHTTQLQGHSRPRARARTAPRPRACVGDGPDGTQAWPAGPRAGRPRPSAGLRSARTAARSARPLRGRGCDSAGHCGWAGLDPVTCRDPAGLGRIGRAG
jgi:hypothetical protein